MPRHLTARIGCAFLLLGGSVAFPSQLIAQMPEDAALVSRIECLLTDLNDDRFKVRQAATAELLRIGPAAASALQRTVADSRSLEVRYRAAGILEIFWNRQRPVAIRSLAGQHQDIVTMAVFSPDGETLASTSEDGTAVLWQWREGKVLRVLKGHVRGVLLAVFSPDGKTLATGGRDAKVILWDVGTGTSRTVISDHTAAVSAVLYSRDGTTFATGSSDRSVKVRDSEGKLRFSLAGHQQDVIMLAFSADAKTLVSAGGNWDNPARQGEVKVWDLETRTARWSAGGEFGGIWGVDLSPDGKLLAGASLDGTVRIWDSASGQARSVLKGHTDRVIWVAYAPGGQWLASSGLDGTVRFWKATDPQAKTIGHVEASAVHRFAFSPREKILATTGSDRTVTIWQIPD